jgi:hypothetical protein
MKYQNIREEELKNKVGADWFKTFDTTEIVGNIDFTAFSKQSNFFGRPPLLWAEAKTGDFDISTMFVQLILTIGKARTFDKSLPPAFLGVFDFKKIAFVPYISIQDIFYINDFNWNVAPSKHDTKEFKIIRERIESNLRESSYIYDYIKDEKELKYFIANNIAKATETSKIRIDKNNFIPIYLRWLDIVKSNIDVNWEDLQKANILDSDFYLADLFVDDKDTNRIEDDSTIRESLFVIFQNQGYKIAKENIKQMFDATINIKAKETYQQFWKRYKRPPVREFQEYIIERRDLLVPQDIRERKGAFFTPLIWVELSQKYLTEVFGENWQDEYFIWDCAAGTGNLLAGLTNKYNIWASTLDQADVKVMHERIQHGANILESHVFQFDFLNDDFSKLPQSLQDVIKDERKRKKLIVYINPPYAEAAQYGNSKNGVSATKTYLEFKAKISFAVNELFSQFFARIYNEIPDCKLAAFSKLKYVTASNFEKFRSYFRAEYLSGFVCRANTFDNVKGNFPISFLIWNLENKKLIEEIECDVLDNDGVIEGRKKFISVKKGKVINDWLRNYYDRQNIIGYLRFVGPDFQANSGVYITSEPKQSDIKESRIQPITQSNLIEMSIYVAVRFCIGFTWLNDRDQFLFPNSNWQVDKEFHNDCLAFTLFNGQNRITSSSTNHWIPFAEQEVDAKEKFASNFMIDFIKGKIINNIRTEDLFNAKQAIYDNQQRHFSEEAKALFGAGCELWKYYHQHKDIKVNAGLYEIREYFQGRNDKGVMNQRSNNEKYSKLIGNIREKLKVLADKISVKVYEYEFLK